MLRFDEEKHEYWLGETRLPSVTECLVTASIVDTRWYTEEGRNRGKAVHLACEYLDLGELDWDSLHPLIRPYVEAYQKFKDETGFNPDLNEQRVFNKKYFYAGTLDRAGWIGNRKVILDIKSGQASPWAAIQLAGYSACLEGRYHRYALQLKDNSTYKLHPEYTDPNDINIFLSSVTITHWKRNHRLAA